MKGLAELKVSAGLQAFNFIDDEEGFTWASSLYPESKDQARARVKENIEAQREACSAQGKKLVIYIVISHGYHVDETKHLFDVPWGTWCDFCACTCYRLEQKQDGSTEKALIHAAKDDYVKTHR